MASASCATCAAWRQPHAPAPSSCRRTSRFGTPARKLADSLGITKILPLDIDRPPLQAGDRLRRVDASEPGAATRRQAAKSLAAPLDRGAIARRICSARRCFELTRQFQVPIGAAYLAIRDQRRFAAYLSALAPSARRVDWSKMSELLPQAAAGDDPLVVPDLEGHPLLGHVAGLSSVRGFAGVPLTSPGGAAWGSLGVFDTKPLTLTTDRSRRADSLRRRHGPPTRADRRRG